MSLVHHRFSVDEYEQMVEHGILDENDRVELIRGEIVDKMPIGDPHAACVNRLTRFLVQKAGDQAIIAVQNPIRLPESVPEPDLSVLRPRDDFYGSSTPRPRDVFLIIEVADTTLDYDRDVKRPMYAEAGIIEYWIFNLIEVCLEVHRQPQPDGQYGDTQILRPGQQIELAALPGVMLAVEKMFPKLDRESHYY
jgi:Uma2 family endonuclease